MKNLEIYDRKPTKEEIKLALTGEDVPPDWWRDTLNQADPKDLNEVRYQDRKRLVYFLADE
ncbi:hypothetical protein HYU93_03075 [Candidatus Daviesbacteria bacterium]|nr:hypothetical protein [Candidatus Daviesbacteria bacterium]